MPSVAQHGGRVFKLHADALSGETLNIVSAPTRAPLTGDALVVGVLSWIAKGP
jgi:hypothetical protein